jgi:L-fuculose-phosphate aldolase
VIRECCIAKKVIVKMCGNQLCDNDETRKALINACLSMNEQGLNQGASGNISARVRDGILITRSGVAYHEMSIADIVKIPFAGDPSLNGYRPSSEWRFHQALFELRKDVAVVLHAHPMHATALAIQRRPIPRCHYMIAAFGGDDIPVAEYAIFGSEKLSANITSVMKNRHACIMANHGALVVGESIKAALWRMQELEALSKQYLLSFIGGQPTLLTKAEIEEALTAFDDYFKSKM